MPGLFFWLGTRPKDQTAEQAASNHSPLFYVDESGLELGVRAMAHVYSSSACNVKLYAVWIFAFVAYRKAEADPERDKLMSQSLI